MFIALGGFNPQPFCGCWVDILDLPDDNVAGGLAKSALFSCGCWLPSTTCGASFDIKWCEENVYDVLTRCKY
jgi:hypothetical protein